MLLIVLHKAMNWQVTLTFQKKPQSAIAWANPIHDLFPLWLHTILNNAQMKLTAKCICIFIKHSYPLEMFANVLVMS